MDIFDSALDTRLVRGLHPKFQPKHDPNWAGRHNCGMDGLAENFYKTVSVVPVYLITMTQKSDYATQHLRMMDKVSKCIYHAMQATN